MLSGNHSLFQRNWKSPRKRWNRKERSRGGRRRGRNEGTRNNGNFLLCVTCKKIQAPCVTLTLPGAGASRAAMQLLTVCLQQPFQTSPPARPRTSEVPVLQWSNVSSSSDLQATSCATSLSSEGPSISAQGTVWVLARAPPSASGLINQMSVLLTDEEQLILFPGFVIYLEEPLDCSCTIKWGNKTFRSLG